MHTAVFEVLRPKNERAAERLGRRYVLDMEETRLTIRRSGVNRGPSVEVEDYPRPEDLIVAVKEKIKKRIHHGYVLIWCSEGWPLLDWMRELEHPIELRPGPTPGIQLELPFGDVAPADNVENPDGDGET